jgi:hypothetical protein
MLSVFPRRQAFPFPSLVKRRRIFLPSVGFQDHSMLVRSDHLGHMQHKSAHLAVVYIEHPKKQDSYSHP